MNVEDIPLDSLTPYNGNPRQIPQQAVDAVARSIDAFGFRVPIITDAEHTIVAGHTRALAARQLGLKTVPVVVVTDLTPDQVRALRLADNQTQTFTTWDSAALDKEVADLQAISAELCEAAGFPLEIEALVQAIREEQPHDSERATQERREKQSKKLAAAVEKVAGLIEANPEARAAVIPLDGRPEVILLADPSFTDFISELKRAIEAGENSPLAAVLRKAKPL